MSSSENRVRVGGWQVEPSLLQISNGETSRRLEPKVMRLLLFLVARAPEVVSREEIFEAVWEGRTVVDETLTRAVSLLRQALGDEARKSRYIETIPTRGYRLVAAVEAVGASVRASPSVPPSSLRDRPAMGSRLRQHRLLLAGLAMVLVVGIGTLLARGGAGKPVAAKPLSARPAVAVLPFDNLSGEVSDLYLADGLSEELTHQLAGIAGLKVASRSSAMRFRDEVEAPERIGELLGVELLLEGSVLVVGDQVRISARLFRPETAEILFSRSFDRDLSDILSLQRAVAKEVVRETRVRLTAAERARLDLQAAVDPQAYRLYLRGLQAIRSRTNDGLQRARALLQQAVEQAPDFALAWSGLADAELLAVQYQLRGSSLVAARQAVERALSLDPGRAQAHSAMGLLQVLAQQDWHQAEAAFFRALELEPSNAAAHRRYSETLALSGRYVEAVDHARAAVDLDPLSPLARAVYGHRLSSAKRYTEAARELSAADDLGASFSWHLRELANVLVRLGDLQGAAAARRSEIARQGESEVELAALDQAVATMGLAGYWAWLRARLADFDDANRFEVAEASAGVGDTEVALRQIAEAIEADVVWFLHGQRSPAFDQLRDDPRYLELMKGLPLWRP